MGLVKWHRRLTASGPSRPYDWLAMAHFLPIALLYGLVARVRALLYRRGVLRSFRAGVPVISIGNLSVGGTGKTPVTDYLLKHLLQRGRRVAVVSRGYGRTGTEPVVVVSAGEGPLVGADRGGDEPVLLAKRNPGAVVIVAPDRRQGISRAIREFAAEVIVLDDGFQHLRVRRDLDILLLDATRPFGNGYPLPLGNLREFPSAAARADLVMLTRSAGDEDVDAGQKPVLHVGYRLAGVAVSAAGEEIALDRLAPGRIGLFAGIADPERFFDSVRQAGIRPVETLSFADHAVYGSHDLAKLHAFATRCDVLLTTEKDLIKLPGVKLPCDCFAVPLQLALKDDRPLFAAIEKIISKHEERDMLPEKLLDVLACPACKGAIAYDSENDRVCCPACRLAYPVRDGIPVMLADEATEL